ncbi:MAG: SCO family protein [Pseudomonadota bacterium]
MMRIAAILGLCAAPLAVAAQGLPDNIPGLPGLVGGDYTLTNQFGETHTQVDPDGKTQLLFFGYANCLQICSSVLPQMGEVADEVAALTGAEIRPVMITVDPKVDTVDSIGPALAYYHDDFIGLTGTDEELQVAYDAFSVEKEFLFEDPEYGPVYAHGSFLYLLDGDGKMLTLIPPILTDTEVVEIIAKYVS